MIDNKKILAVIPARGGSKGIPGKNIREVGGKPLIAWTIAEAKKSKYIDRLILSSDSPEIIEVARAWGCDAPFVRPAELARDDTDGVAPVLHAIAMIDDYDFVVLLQATSPLRNAEDIDACIEQCMRLKANACVSVTEVEQSPFLMYSINEKNKLKPVIELAVPHTRRQDMPPVYRLNGAVYMADCAWLSSQKTFLSNETAAYIMPIKRSLDIDTESDLQILQQHYENFANV